MALQLGQATEGSLHQSSGSCALQGDVTSDIKAFSPSGPPLTVSFVEDTSGPTLVLNTTAAYPGTASPASQVSAAHLPCMQAPCGCHCCKRSLFLEVIKHTG